MKWQNENAEQVRYCSCFLFSNILVRARSLREVFTKVNGYPTWVFQQESDEVELERAQTRVVQEEQENSKETMLIVPYQGEKGEKVLSAVPSP